MTRFSYKKSAHLSIVLYVIGVIVAGFLMYSLPDTLVNNTQAIGIVELNEIKPYINQLTLSVAIVFLLGFISIILFIIQSRKNSTENIIYVESFGEEKKSQEEETENQHHETQEGQYLDSVKQKIESVKQQEEEYQKVFDRSLSLLCQELEASQAGVYYTTEEEGIHYLKLCASFAYPIPESEEIKFEFGEGLAGQAAKEQRIINIDNVPDGYIRILSGLGSASPNNLLIVPVIQDQHVVGVVEIASFKPFTQAHENLIQEAFGDMEGFLKHDNAL